MLLLTYRTDELHRRHALRPLLAELERLERARRIELEPFDRDELSEALADILGAAPDAKLRRASVRAQRRQPALHGGAAGGRARRARRRRRRACATRSCVRIERLSDETQRATRAVAVGRALDESTLSAVTGRRSRRGPDGAARGGRRAGADRRRRRALLLPPRAAARGAVRRPAARRARRAGISRWRGARGGASWAARSASSIARR